MLLSNQDVRPTLALAHHLDIIVEFVSRQQIVPLYILMVSINSCANIGLILLHERDKRNSGTEYPGQSVALREVHYN